MPRVIIAAALLFVLNGHPSAAATVDGMNIHWTSSGSGPAIVLVHGWTCDETSWKEQVPELSKRFRVITLDLPGHGRSDSPKDGKFSMALFARAVEAVRAEARVERAVVGGHSMGTPVIRQYALMYPKRVAGLVIVDGMVQLAGAGAPFALPGMTGEAGLKTREGMVRGMFGQATTPALQEHILKMMLATKEATAAGAMAATWDSSWVTNDQIAVPTLAVFAEAGPGVRGQRQADLPEGRVSPRPWHGALFDDGEAAGVQSVGVRVRRPTEVLISHVAGRRPASRLREAARLSSARCPSEHGERQSDNGAVEPEIVRIDSSPRVRSA